MIQNVLGIKNMINLGKYLSCPIINGKVDKQPKVLFLVETKSNKTRMEFVRSVLGFQNLFTVESVCKSGGLALTWEKEVTNPRSVIYKSSYWCRCPYGKGYWLEADSHLQMG